MAGKPVTTEDGWTTVSEPEVDENKIVFDIIGDEFIGTYLDTRVVPGQDGSYSQARFMGINDEVYFINANHSLRHGLTNVKAGKMVRITFTDEKDTGQASPMRVFRVDVKR